MVTEQTQEGATRTEHGAGAEAGRRIVQFVCFVVDKKPYALPLDRVERVVRMVAVTPVPATPAYVAGMIDLQGHVVPVVNLRKRFGLPHRPTGLDDRLVVASTGEGRSVALMVDEVTELLEVQARHVEPPPPAPKAKARPVDAVVRRNDQLIMVIDTDRLIPSGKQLRALLKGETGE